MIKVNTIFKPFLNIIQDALSFYNHRILSITHGSLSFINDGKYYDISCPLKNRNIKAVEVGVFRGRNSKEIMKLLDINKLYLIDIWNSSGNDYLDDTTNNNNMGNLDFDKAEKKVRKRMLKFGDKIVFIKKFSDEAAKDIPYDMDYIYLDGDHRYEKVKKDIENYYEKVKERGILAGHDISIPDVSKAVVEFTKENNLDFFIKNEDWIIIKPIK